MSKANTPNTFTNKPQAASAAATGASAPASRPTSAFNYAAAAAKSKPAATSFAAAAAAGVSSASQASSGAATPTTTGASTPGPSQQQQQQSASSSSSATPATAIPVPQNGSRPQGSSGALVNGAPQSSHNRRQSAVSVAKGQSGTLPIAVKSAGSRDSINFGSIAEANALLSSSPAAVPEAIRQPRQFGTVEAAKPDPNMNGEYRGHPGGSAQRRCDFHRSAATPP
ncbi:unnamed protein product [Tilletia controversa]|nr:unnamed protein product [Tilletia controversa]